MIKVGDHLSADIRNTIGVDYREHLPSQLCQGHSFERVRTSTRVQDSPLARDRPSQRPEPERVLGQEVRNKIGAGDWDCPS